MDRRNRQEISRKISQTKQRIERLVDAIAEGVATRATRDRLLVEETERARMEQKLSRMETRARSVIELHPRAIARYQERVAALTDALRGGNPERAAVVTISGASSIASTSRPSWRAVKSR